ASAARHDPRVTRPCAFEPTSPFARLPIDFHPTPQRRAAAAGSRRCAIFFAVTGRPASLPPIRLPLRLDRAAVLALNRWMLDAPLKDRYTYKKEVLRRLEQRDAKKLEEMAEAGARKRNRQWKLPGRRLNDSSPTGSQLLCWSPSAVPAAQTLAGIPARTLFDYGSGVGTSAWAANTVWPGLLREHFMVDPCSSMNSLAGLLMQPAWIAATILVTCAHSLLTLQDAGLRADTLDTLWAKVEPGGALGRICRRGRARANTCWIIMAWPMRTPPAVTCGRRSHCGPVSARLALSERPSGGLRGDLALPAWPRIIETGSSRVRTDSVRRHGKDSHGQALSAFACQTALPVATGFSRGNTDPDFCWSLTPPKSGDRLPALVDSETGESCPEPLPEPDWADDEGESIEDRVEESTGAVSG
uniref:Uncharacterized protein n=1 Tax=Macrostomum lignano TaxID=282301 RepID=A0A1I8F841_9PLAT